ncbi:MAG TPA: glycosyltransferase family 2 protein [Coleofasciculaceae cyanobacterium]|jgi:GT2 family glycosyltransferase
MKRLPDIDVVLLSWNRSQMTLETVHNLIKQEDVNLKIWIVDQGSKEEELQLLKEATKQYPNVQITELKRNVGVPAGRNIGTHLGNAEYTVSIDNDAIFESSDALKRVVEIFEQEPKIAVVSFRIKNFYTGQDDELSWVYPKTLKSSRDKRFLTARFVGCGHAIRRQVFEKVGGYDDDLFFYWEEVDFSFRAINLGYQLVYTPEISVLHKVAPEARVRWEDQRFYFLVRNAIYINLKYNQDFLKALVLALGYTVKGFYNFLPLQALRGVVDGIRMYKKLSFKSLGSSLQLTESARNYVWEHETQYRGNLLNRLKSEVFVGLPTRD